MLHEIQVPDWAGLIISILLMALTILFGNWVVLRYKPTPYRQALLIATTSNILGKLFVSFLHFPAWVSYSIPTLAFFLLSYYFFKPSLKQMILYWLAGFVSYLAIHILISIFFGWTFMFPFWDIKKYL